MTQCLQKQAELTKVALQLHYPQTVLADIMMDMLDPRPRCKLCKKPTNDLCTRCRTGGVHNEPRPSSCEAEEQGMCSTCVTTCQTCQQKVSAEEVLCLGCPARHHAECIPLCKWKCCDHKGDFACELCVLNHVLCDGCDGFVGEDQSFTCSDCDKTFCSCTSNTDDRCRTCHEASLETCAVCDDPCDSDEDDIYQCGQCGLMLHMQCMQLNINDNVLVCESCWVARSWCP